LGIVVRVRALSIGDAPAARGRWPGDYDVICSRSAARDSRFARHNAPTVLADFHSSRVEVPRLRHPERLLRSLDRKAKQVAPSLNDSFQTVISQCLRPIAPVGDPLVVTHGDFSPRNLLSDGSNLVLIDFDRLQMAGRGRDLGYFGAWVWVTEFMNEPTTNPSWAVADELISLYSKLTEITESSLRQTAPFYRAAALLRIAQSWSALGDRPDLSRVIIETAAKVSGEKP
jgi:aminoglycoside phosphotransferase (APT) family kinase protein